MGLLIYVVGGTGTWDIIHLTGPPTVVCLLQDLKTRYNVHYVAEVDLCRVFSPLNIQGYPRLVCMSDL